MAISIEDQPYTWAPRGQKLMIIASSTETGQNGFRYGVTINNATTGQSFDFYFTPSPDGRMYFDMQPLIQLWNKEEKYMHSLGLYTSYDDSTNALNEITFSISEWWLVAGALTLNEGSAVSGDAIAVVNGYYQVSDGYKVFADTPVYTKGYSLSNSTARAMSDRLPSTHINKYIAGPDANNIFIPVREQDYGLLYIPGNSHYLVTNDVYQYRVILYDSDYDSHIGSYVTCSGYAIEGLPVYPANINAESGYDVRPADYPGWKYYRINIKGSGGSQNSITYIFYNACEFNMCDCTFENIRLGWVNSRSGWDYFNFNKRSEFTNEIERKTYRKVLLNNTPTVFEPFDRGLKQRQNIVNRVLTINSDYIQKGEFELLRGLFVSNQVHWLQDDGTFIPVNIDDTSYTEKNTADGKLYNVTLKLRMANEYWT